VHQTNRFLKEGFILVLVQSQLKASLLARSLT
jgi:hypothetical protein